MTDEKLGIRDALPAYMRLVRQFSGCHHLNLAGQPLFALQVCAVVSHWEQLLQCTEHEQQVLLATQQSCLQQLQ